MTRLLPLTIITALFIVNSACLAEPKLVWSDEFDVPGLPDPAKWSYNSGILGFNEELQYYSEADPRNARVTDDGVLIIEAHKETSPETPFGDTADYTSARLVTKAKGDWLYGRFEIRAKLPYGNGTWPAIWMLPTGNVYGGWPHSGEIDIMEHVGSHMGDVLGTLHYSTRHADKGPTKSIEVRNVETQFHVYAVEWRPGEIKFFINDVCYHTRTDPQTGWQDWPFDQPFHIILNIAVGGTLGGKKGVDPDIWPQRMEVDYVRVYDLGDSPRLDNDGDGLVNAEYPDDDNDGFSDVEELDAGSNPYKGDSTPVTRLALLRTDGSNNGLGSWSKRTQTFTTEGEVIADTFDAPGPKEFSVDEDGRIVLTGSPPESGRVDTYIFQPTDIRQGLEPGDVITFSGTASYDATGESKAEAFIYVYTTAGGMHPTTVFAPIGSTSESFSLTTTLQKGPVQGVAVGFVNRVSAGKGSSIIFSDLAAKVVKR